MSIHSLKGSDRFLALGMSQLHDLGVRLRVGTDFQEYQNILAEGRPGYIIGDPFRADLHRLNKSNAFWMVGAEEDGTIVHTQAMRVLHLRNRSLGEYLRYGFKQFPPPGVDIDFQRSRYRAGPGARRMFGRIAYHGEFWIGGQDGQYRGAGWSALLGRMAFVQAAKLWDPDYVFGFMAKKVACKGFMARHGYMHCEPGALRWYLGGRPDPIEGFLVYMGREDMDYLLDLPFSEMEALAA